MFLRLLNAVSEADRPSLQAHETTLTPLVDRMFGEVREATRILSELPDEPGPAIAVVMARWYGSQVGPYVAPLLSVAYQRWPEPFLARLGQSLATNPPVKPCQRAWISWMTQLDPAPELLPLAIPALGCDQDTAARQAFSFVTRMGDQARSALEAALAPDSPYKSRPLILRPARDLLGKLQGASAERVPEGELLRTLVLAWGCTHHPKLAEAIEVESTRISPKIPVFKKVADRTAWWREKAATQDPYWLSVLLSDMWPAQLDEGISRIKLLSAFPPDPRTATFLVRSLTEGVYPLARQRYEIVSMCLTLLGKIGSPIEAAALEQSRPGLGMIINLNVLDRVVASLKNVPVIEPSEEILAQMPKAPEAALTAEELLDKIMANPDDLGLHQVYADLLSERGDVRGEFISLQCGEQTPTSLKRQDKLLNEHIEAWVSRPKGAIARGAWFQHGFLKQAMISQGSLQAMTDDPLWATVDTLDISEMGYFDTNYLEWLLKHPNFRNIKHLLGVTPEWNPSPVADRLHTVGIAHHYGPNQGKQFPHARVLETFDHVTNPSIVKGTQIVHLRCAVRYLSVERGKLTELKRHALKNGQELQSIYLRMAGLSLDPAGWVVGLEGDLMSTLVVQYFGGIDAKKHAAHLSQFEDLEGIERVRIEAAAKITGVARESLEAALKPFSGVSKREEVSVRADRLIRRWVTGER